jgi:hypothetical protein
MMSDHHSVTLSRRRMLKLGAFASLGAAAHSRRRRRRDVFKFD